MLPPEPLVGLPVYPFWLLRERLRRVRAPSKTLPDGLCPVEGMVHRVTSLALVDEIVAMTAQLVNLWGVPAGATTICPPVALTVSSPTVKVSSPSWTTKTSA